MVNKGRSSMTAEEMGLGRGKGGKASQVWDSRAKSLF